MQSERLVHNADITIDGETYSVSVYCRPDGRHYAKTYLNENDIIINDGPSLTSVLEAHQGLLPLAVSAHRTREILKRETSRSRNSRIDGVD